MSPAVALARLGRGLAERWPIWGMCRSPLGRTLLHATKNYPARQAGARKERGVSRREQGRHPQVDRGV